MTNEKDQIDLPIKITVSWFHQAIYLIGVIGSAYVTTLSWLSTEIMGISLCFGIFFLLCAYAFFLSRSTIRVDDQSLTMTAPHGVYKINWDEVETIETDNVAIALFGKDKYLSMNLTMAGNDKQKGDFFILLNAIISERKIQVRPLTSMWIFQKNTKIRGFGLRF